MKKIKRRPDCLLGIITKLQVDGMATLLFNSRDGQEIFSSPNTPPFTGYGGLVTSILCLISSHTNFSFPAALLLL